MACVPQSASSMIISIWNVDVMRHMLLVVCYNGLQFADLADIHIYLCYAGCVSALVYSTQFIRQSQSHIHNIIVKIAKLIILALEAWTCIANRHTHNNPTWLVWRQSDFGTCHCMVQQQAQHIGGRQSGKCVAQQSMSLHGGQITPM